MNSSILTTKLFIPPVRPDLMPRPHLIEKLNESTKFPVTLISASAGSGKTTILSEWAANANRPVAWVSLESDDNDPAQFLTYFISALRTFQKDFGLETINLLTSSQSDAIEMVLINLINEIVELSGNITVIFDDYHTITNTKINDLVTLMIEHLPPQLHLVFASRIDPAWPLARYRSRNQIYEMRGHDLQFNEQEAANFLNCSMGLDLSVDQVAALEERTEGWIAGLQLAAISMQRQEDISKFIEEFTGSHLYVAEYLIEEILNQQPEDIQSFLVKSSILDRLNATLCEAVSETPDGQAILNFLYKANIFLVPLDNQGDWFRYHHLFADLLRSRLQQTYTSEQIAELHMRASDWFESNQLAVEAVHHMLAANNPEKAAFLVNKHGQAIFFSERYNILKNWLNAIPDEYLQKYPRLEIYRLLIDLLEGTLDMYEKTLAEKEALIKALPPSPENDRLRRRALVNLSLFYAFQNTRKAIQIAEETLEEIPEDDLHMRAYLYSSFYRAYGMEGDVDKASAAYRESFRLANITNQFEMISNTTKIRTFDLCQYGKLDEAAEYCQRIIDIGSSQKIKVFYPAGPCYVGLAGIHLERNDLEKAEEYLHIGLELCHQGAKYGLFTGNVQKIRLLQAKGQLEEALEELQIFEQTFQRREFTFLAQKVSLLVAANELERASEMVPYLQELLGVSYYAKNLPLIAREFFMFCLARIYLAQGELDKVFPLLDEIQTTVEPDKRFGRLMELYLLRALAKNKQSADKIPPKAIADLEKALELAIEPGFVMLFLEEGPALIPLLQAVTNHQEASHEVRHYAQKLLQAFEKTGQLPAEAAVPAVQQLVEQLTPRELEVLQLVATGASNREIADTLVITIRTVKKHTSNIYGKLNVGSRTQAVAYAREIGLLPTN